MNKQALIFLAWTLQIVGGILLLIIDWKILIGVALIIQANNIWQKLDRDK